MVDKIQPYKNILHFQSTLSTKKKKKFVFQLKSSKLICVQMKLKTHKMQVQSTRLTTIYMEKSQTFFKECVRIKGIYEVDTRT